ncbi:MAG: FG-GAP-like repeat-containing protein [Candidatus Methanofastidiosia archaeon]
MRKVFTAWLASLIILSIIEIGVVGNEEQPDIEVLSRSAKPNPQDCLKNNFDKLLDELTENASIDELLDWLLEIFDSYIEEMREDYSQEEIVEKLLSILGPGSTEVDEDVLRRTLESMISQPKDDYGNIILTPFWRKEYKRYLSWYFIRHLIVSRYFENLEVSGESTPKVVDKMILPPGKSELNYPIYWWSQIDKDYTSNPLERVIAFEDKNSSNATCYMLVFKGERSCKDLWTAFYTYVLHPILHGDKKDLATIFKTYVHGAKDIEPLLVADNKIIFCNVWDKNQKFGDCGQHGSTMSVYNRLARIYINTWNHLMGLKDTNSSEGKKLLFTDWNKEEDGENNNKTPEKNPRWCKLNDQGSSTTALPKENSNCCKSSYTFGITSSIEPEFCEFPDEYEFFPVPPGEDHPDDFNGVLCHSMEGLSYDSSDYYEILDYGISILDRGYSIGSYRILASLRYPSYPLRLFFSPFEVSEELPILVLPSGSLFGLENSFLTKTLLELYVENGGTLIVFSQQHGEDYQILPRGDEIYGYGWREDISCNFKSAGIASYDHLFSGQKDVILNLNVDGFFTKVPEDSTVLLARTRDGTPCLFSYPCGKGKVIVSSLYMDHAYLQGAGTRDEQILLRDMVEWSVHGSPQAFLPDQSITLPVEITNNSSKAASRIVFSVKNPEKEEVMTIEEEAVLEPNQKIEKTLNLGQLSSLGYYIVKCTLLDENSETIDINENVGVFVVSILAGDDSGYSCLPELGFAITSESEYFACGSPAVFTFHIWNRSNEDKNILCRFIFPHHGIGTYWQNPIIREVFAPQGQETTFTYTLSSVWTYDRLWAEFFDENGDFIGAASRGLYEFTPSFEIHVRRDRDAYGRGDTALVSTRITNKLKYTSPAYLKLVIKDNNGGELYSAERIVWLEGYETREEVFQFSIPIDIDYGNLKVEASLPPSFYCDFKANTVLPVRKPTMSLRIDKSETEQGQVIVEVTNTGDPGINDGVLTLSVDRDGEEFFKENRSFTLAARQSELVAFSVPLEEGKLSVYTIKAETNYGTVEETEFDTRPIISISLLSDTLKVTQNLEGTVSVENSMPFSWNLWVELWIDNLGMSEQHQLALAPYECQEISFTYSLPSDALWGSYRIQCRITSEGTSASQFSSFNILPPSLSAALSGTVFSSGGGISILVRNSGGCPSEFEFEASLTDAKGNMVWYEEGSDSIWVDEDIPLDSVIPENLVDGYYHFAFNGRDLRSNKPFYVVRIVKITGKKALLSVATSKNIYFTDEDIHCLADIHNEDGALNANLLLEIVQFTEKVQRDDWWKFRHDLGNTGASSLSSSLENYTYGWILPLLYVSSSPAVRDITNDGIPDVIVISDEGIVYVIDGVKGLPLWSYETLTYPYYPSSPTVEDVDEDGSAEILISAENKLLVLTCTGQLKWEFAFNPDPYDPWRFSNIYSSPVVADLDNNGSKEVIAAFEDGLFVLDGETGSEIWHIEDRFTSSTPAVADLGSDGYLEIIVGQEYGLFAYTSTGALMWDYPLSFVESSPVVADIDRDGELEVIGRDWSGDLYVLSENGVLIWVDSCPPVYESESPAVGDLDGDGQSEVVIPIGLNGIRVIETDGTFMWEFYIDPYFEIEYFVSSPALADLNGDGNLDVVVQSDKYLYFFDGSNGNIIWREPDIHGYSSPAIADVDGDGEAEIIACEESGMVYCIDSESSLKKASSRSSGEKVLWSTTVPVSLGESQSIGLEHLATIQAEGLFLLRGTLIAENGQEMVTDECYFYIYPGELAITIATDKEIYWPNEQVRIQGELLNNSIDVREGDLIISEGGQEIFSVPFSLSPGESMPYVTSFVCDSETTVCVTAASISVEKPIYVESPHVFCEITAPDTVDHALFEAFLKITNPGKRAVSLDVSFYGYEYHVLEPDETIILERPIQISEDTVLSAVISGDVSQTVQKEVIMGEKVTVTMSPEGSYLAGDVEIPFTLSNTGILDSVISVEFQIDAATIEKEYVVNVGGSIQDVLSLTIMEGDHHLTVKTPFEELHFDIEGIVIKEDQAALQASIPETAGETLSFAATVINTGDNIFTGRIDAYTPFWAESIEIQVENEQEFFFDVPTEPGVFTIKMKLICNGEIIAEIEQEVEAVHPPPSLHVLEEPSGSYTVGENASMTFILENTGGAGPCEFFFDIPGIYNRIMRFSVDKGEIKDISFDILIPEDIPTGDYTGIYVVNGTEYKFDFHVDGVNISVSALLDRTAYNKGDSAVFTVSVAPSGSYTLRVNYGNYSSEEEFENEISITIPVSETRDIFYGVYDAVTKRSLYMSSLLLQAEKEFSVYTDMIPVTGEFSIYVDKLIYNPGDTVTVTVETAAPGTLYVNAYEIETFEISDIFQFSFALPEDTVSMTYEIPYFFIGDNGFISSSFPVKVEGYSVKVYQCKLSKKVYNPLDTVHSEFIFNSNVSVQGVFEAEIVDPIGNVLATYEMPISLEEGDNDLSLDLDFSTEYAGSHKLRYSIYSGDLTLVSAKEYFDVGGPVILNMTTDKDVYEEGEPVKVHLDIYGNGAALLILRLDDDIVETKSLNLSGFEVQDFQLIIQEGFHIIDAELSANLKSTAYTFVSILGEEPAPVESEQPEIDMRPLAQYHIEQAEQLKEEAESLLEQARDKGINATSIEELYKKANEYLETAKAFLMTVPVVANNWALQAIEAYKEVIELLENLLVENG